MKSLFRMLGLALVLVGISGVIYYYFYFDTSVGTSLGRVNNIGLLAERSDSLMLSFFSIIGGIVLIFIGKDPTKGVGKTKQRCRKCGELISIHARECIHCGQSALRLNSRR